MTDVIEIDYEALPESAPLSHQLMAGAFAGIMEHSIMFPVDAIKTRMQALSHNNFTGVLNAITRISTTEGSLALWKGVQSVILGAGPAHAVYFATYEFAKDQLIPEEDRDKHQPIKTAMAGTCATIAADALMNPFDTIKQRMQLGTSKSMTAMASEIYQKEGFRAFYYSYPTTLAMNIPFAALNFVIYESSTKMLNPGNTYNPLVHCFCGGLAGATCAAITTPLDCIKTVLQIRGDKHSPEIVKQADSFPKAARAIFKVYGWKGFWKGLRPRIISNVPATAISWTSYEFAKQIFRGE